MLKLLCLVWIIGIASIGIEHPALVHLNLNYCSIGVLLCVCSYLLLWYRHKLASCLVLRLLLMLLASVLLLACASLFADVKLQQALDQQVQTRQQIDAVIYVKQLTAGSRQQPHQVVELLLPKAAASKRILLYPAWQAVDAKQPVGQLDLQLGRYYLASLQLKPPQDQVNAAGFDGQAWYLQQHIHGTATLLYAQPLSEVQLQQMGYARHLQQQTRHVAQLTLAIEQLRLSYRQQLLGSDATPTRGLLLALLTGDRSGIDSQTRLLYQSMGISHLLAISGPHVLLLAVIWVWLLGQCLHLLMRHGLLDRLYLHIAKQYLYLPLFLGCISFYVAFTGFEIPALRTWLISCICILALLFKLPISKLSLLLIAAAIVLLLDPLAILSAAFWLSFCAAALMLWVYQNRQPSSQPWSIAAFNQWLQLLWQSQWRIFVLLLPLILWQFKAVSLIAPLVNLIAIPCLTLLIIPLNILAASVWLLAPSLAEWLWWCSAGLLHGFNLLLMQLQPLADYLYLNSYLSGQHLFALSCGIALICLSAGMLPRFWALFFILPLLFDLRPQPLLQLDVLDVGQGQALYIASKQHHMLVDTARGSWSQDGPSMADREIVPFLRSRGVRKLDLLLLSHLDDDHRGGLETISRYFDIDLISANMSDAGIRALEIPFRTCLRGQSWQWDQLKFEILHPDQQDPRQDQNESSCVLLISSRMQQSSFKLLLMGDVGWQSEYQIMRRYPNLQVDIVVLGHHGSRHSSAYDFLAQINPKLAIISAGADNRYGHPSAEVLARLAALNIPVLSTIEDGAIHISLNDAAGIWQWRAERDRRKWLRARMQ